MDFILPNSLPDLLLPCDDKNDIENNYNKMKSTFPKLTTNVEDLNKLDYLYSIDKELFSSTVINGLKKILSINKYKLAQLSLLYEISSKSQLLTSLIDTYSNTTTDILTSYFKAFSNLPGNFNISANQAQQKLVNLLRMEFSVATTSNPYKAIKISLKKDDTAQTSNIDLVGLASTQLQNVIYDKQKLIFNTENVDTTNSNYRVPGSVLLDVVKGIVLLDQMTIDEAKYAGAKIDGFIK